MNPVAPYQLRIEQLIQRTLDELRANPLCPPQLLDAMAYVLQAPGKFMRPNLVYLTGSLLGVPLQRLDGAALAVELIHIYSLTHDDLPAMDDAALRRGQTTCHLQFDEATAILVGDGLLPLAFEKLSQAPLPPDRVLMMITTLTRASGVTGMVAGQIWDLAGEKTTYTLDQIQRMHQLKTGAMIQACVQMGVIASGLDDVDSLYALENYGNAIGLAFQIQDDILDACSDTQTLGKPAGLDDAAGKSSYVSLRGIDAAKSDLAQLHADAHKALAHFAPSNAKAMIMEFTDALLVRTY